MMMMMMVLVRLSTANNDNDDIHDDDDNCSEAIICIPSSYAVHNFDFKLQQVSFTSRLSPLQQYDKSTTVYDLKFKFNLKLSMMIDDCWLLLSDRLTLSD